MPIKRRIFLAAFLAALALGAGPAAPPAIAGPVGDAKAAGLVGERPDGYLGVVKPGAEAVVSQANARRRAEYQAIATKRGSNLAAVESVAGRKRMAASPAGTFVFSGGKWLRK
ncbi:MAG: YdbL family protein [Alphaproteobacteria bacterium]